MRISIEFGGFYGSIHEGLVEGASYRPTWLEIKPVILQAVA